MTHYIVNEGKYTKITMWFGIILLKHLETADESTGEDTRMKFA